MKTKILLLSALMSLGMLTKAQNSESPKKTLKTDIYTSLKPADMHPAIFSSQADYDAKIQDKKNNVLADIRANKDDSVKVKKLRELLWRFENAIVKAPKNQ